MVSDLFYKDNVSDDDDNNFNFNFIYPNFNLSAENGFNRKNLEVLNTKEEKLFEVNSEMFKAVNEVSGLKETVNLNVQKEGIIPVDIVPGIDGIEVVENVKMEKKDVIGNFLRRFFYIKKVNGHTKDGLDINLKDGIC